MFYVRKIEGTEFMEINKHKFKIMMKTKKLYIFDFRMYDPNYQMFCCRNFSGIQKKKAILFTMTHFLC